VCSYIKKRTPTWHVWQDQHAGTFQVNRFEWHGLYVSFPNRLISAEPAEKDSLPGVSIVGIPQSETRGNYTIANYVLTPTNYSL
jgi:hypothetical protein